MKFRTMIPLVALAALASVMGACSLGQSARDTAAETTVQLASSGVEADVRAGITFAEMNDTDDTLDDGAATAIADDFFGALASEDRWTITVTSIPLWPTVRGYAEDGFQFRIDAGEIGPGVAESKMTRLDEFEGVLLKLPQGAEPPGDE